MLFTLPSSLDLSANWILDLQMIPMDISRSTAPTGITFGAGDESNIYKLLLTAAAITMPNVVVDTSGARASDGILLSVPDTANKQPPRGGIYWVQNGTNVAQWIGSCNLCPNTDIRPCGASPVPSRRDVASLSAAGYVGENRAFSFDCKIKVLKPSITAQEIRTKIRDISDSAIRTLLTSYGFPQLTGTGAATDAQIQAVITNFQNRVGFTYSAYEKMYKAALTFYFTNSTIENKSVAALLNLKLLVLIHGLNRIRSYFQTMTASIIRANASNTALMTTTGTLESQLESLITKDGDRALYSRMVEYTEEKNQAHRNLLGLYSVLNLVALGIIFYIARE